MDLNLLFETFKNKYYRYSSGVAFSTENVLGLIFSTISDNRDNRGDFITIMIKDTSNDIEYSVNVLKNGEPAKSIGEIKNMSDDEVIKFINDLP